MCPPKITSPGRQVTVIIRDDSPLEYTGDSPSYRTVRFELTPEQEALIMLRATGGTAANPWYEVVSRVILEKAESEVTK